MVARRRIDADKNMIRAKQRIRCRCHMYRSQHSDTAECSTILSRNFQALKQMRNFEARSNKVYRVKVEATDSHGLSDSQESHRHSYQRGRGRHRHPGKSAGAGRHLNNRQTQRSRRGAVQPQVAVGEVGESEWHQPRSTNSTIQLELVHTGRVRRGRLPGCVC